MECIHHKDLLICLVDLVTDRGFLLDLPSKVEFVRISMDKDEGPWDPFGFPAPPGASPWTAAEKHTDLRNC